jgi:tetratricopeptide (TPR) repeat protein
MVVKPEWLDMGGPASLFILGGLVFFVSYNILGAYFGLLYVRRGAGRRRSIKRVRDLVNRASSLYEVGDYDGALKLLSKALAICRAARDAEGEADQLGNVGLVLNRKGDFAGAVDCFERALEVYRGIGDAVGVANQMANLSVARERLEIADAVLKTPRELPEEAGNRERTPVRVRRASG